MDGINICQTTGLLYIQGVPFTRDHLKKLRKFFKYSKKVGGGQMKHRICVINTYDESSVTIDAEIIKKVFKEYDVNEIASDKDFN